MTDPAIERAIALLCDAPRVTLPLAELARRLGYGDPDALARLLDADHRVLVLDPPLLPGLATFPAAGRAAYDVALRRAGLCGVRRVALVRRPAPGPGADTAELLRQTAARLLAPDVEANTVASVAERANRAVISTLAADA